MIINIYIWMRCDKVCFAVVAEMMQMCEKPELSSNV